jgi:hypothetical protein
MRGFRQPGHFSEVPEGTLGYTATLQPLADCRSNIAARSLLDSLREEDLEGFGPAGNQRTRPLTRRAFLPAFRDD